MCARSAEYSSIDEYLADIDPVGRNALQQLRNAVRLAAPEAEECISYARPAFRQGHIICGFGAAKNHCAFYLFSSTALSGLADELRGFDTGKGSIRFSPDRPLPDHLVHELVKIRLAENAARVRKSTERRGSALSVETLYEKYYGAQKARRGIFDALAAWRSPERVLYPGSFIHVTASFCFPSVVYVDTDRVASRFFFKLEDVLTLVSRHKAYSTAPELEFHGSSYEADIGEPANSFDLLLSLYAGFISKPCKRYLKVGGILAVNNSHGDAGLASIDPDYRLVAVLQKKSDRFHVVEENLGAYFKPKKEMELSEDLLRRLGRGIGYTKTAPVYLFQRVR